jgi:hypothetical protein
VGHCIGIDYSNQHIKVFDMIFRRHSFRLNSLCHTHLQREKACHNKSFISVSSCYHTFSIFLYKESIFVKFPISRFILLLITSLLGSLLESELYNLDSLCIIKPIHLRNYIIFISITQIFR